MTKEEAITNLNMISIAFVDPVTREQRKLINDTFKMAIQALSQEPCDDAISREDAINAFDEHPYDTLSYASARNIIRELPSVTQKSGKWHRKYDRIVNDCFWECDKCGCGYQHEYNYCPNCGAKMVEPQESEDKG